MIRKTTHPHNHTIASLSNKLAAMNTNLDDIKSAKGEPHQQKKNYMDTYNWCNENHTYGSCGYLLSHRSLVKPRHNSKTCNEFESKAGNIKEVTRGKTMSGSTRVNTRI